MASSVIHMAVANEVNKVLKRNPKDLFIGTIAPDISKHIGESKVRSHFLDEEVTGIPNMERFLEKYQSFLSDDFVMGYFIHLYTDYLWFKYFIPEIYEKDFITKLDGTVVKCYGNMADLYIYNDYTDLNIKLIDQYQMDCKIFYEEIPTFKNIIEEIPMDKIHIIVEKAGEIIENSKSKKDYVIQIEHVNQFIDTSVKLVLAKIREIEDKSI